MSALRHGATGQLLHAQRPAGAAVQSLQCCVHKDALKHGRQRSTHLLAGQIDSSLSGPAAVRSGLLLHAQRPARAAVHCARTDAHKHGAAACCDERTPHGRHTPAGAAVQSLQCCTRTDTLKRRAAACCGERTGAATPACR